MLWTPRVTAGELVEQRLRSNAKLLRALLFVAMLLIFMTSHMDPAWQARAVATPFENDWGVFVAGSTLWLRGVDPYQLPGHPFASPPYSLVFFAALSWVPAKLALFFPLLSLFYAAWRLHKYHLVPIVGLSLPFMLCTHYGNIDWLSMIAPVVGGELGVIFASIKPQTGLGVIVSEAAKRRTWRERLWLVLPLAIAGLLTLPLLGSWLAAAGEMRARTWNYSLFPYSVPFGVMALYLAWRRRDALWGVVASMCLSPYWYSASLLPLVFLIAERSWKWGIVASSATWLIAWLVGTGVIMRTLL